MKGIMNKYPIFFIITFIVYFHMSSLCFSQGAAGKVSTKNAEVLKKGDDLYKTGSHEFTMNYDGKKRNYGVYLPLKYGNGSIKMPVVIYLHGGGGRIKTAYHDDMDKAADKFGFILAIPVATRVKRGLLGTRWNGGKWEGGECCGSADDVGFISMMIEELKEKFNADGTRVYATGISNGGLMANRLACELSDKIAAVAVVAPAAIPGNCRPSRPVSVMDIHGTGDPCNPYDGSMPKGACGKVDYRRMPPNKVVDSWLEILGCSRDASIVYEKGDAKCMSYKGKNGSEVVFCRVEGMGHTWPSGAQYLPVRAVGKVSTDISFDQMWTFFQRHSL